MGNSECRIHCNEFYDGSRGRRRSLNLSIRIQASGKSGFALRIIRLVQSLPATPTAHLIGKQLLRCRTAARANHLAARQARSAKWFYAKLGIVEEEADESAYWME